MTGVWDEAEVKKLKKLHKGGDKSAVDENAWLKAVKTV